MENRMNLIKDKHFISSDAKKYFPYYKNKLNICAYFRYNPKKDKGISSLQFQEKYYKEAFGNIPNWDLKSIFADSSYKKNDTNRTQFIKMLDKGKKKRHTSKAFL